MLSLFLLSSLEVSEELSSMIWSIQSIKLSWTFWFSRDLVNKLPFSLDFSLLSRLSFPSFDTSRISMFLSNFGSNGLLCGWNMKFMFRSDRLKDFSRNVLGDSSLKYFSTRSFPNEDCFRCLINRFSNSCELCFFNYSK